MRRPVRTAFAAVLAAGASAPAMTCAQQGAPGVAAYPDGSVVMRPTGVGDDIARNSRTLATMGFFDTEPARTSDSAGRIPHVSSTYEARHAPGDATPFMRGIDSIQPGQDGRRWHVSGLAWRAEDAALPLPERDLQGG